jgi:hypothetical protein
MGKKRREGNGMGAREGEGELGKSSSNSNVYRFPKGLAESKAENGSGRSEGRRERGWMGNRRRRKKERCKREVKKRRREDGRPCPRFASPFSLLRLE